MIALGARYCCTYKLIRSPVEVGEHYLIVRLAVLPFCIHVFPNPHVGVVLEHRGKQKLQK